MSVAIFGATSRLSHALALEYGRLGLPIYLAARDVDEAERIAMDVGVRTNTSVRYGSFDALDYSAHSRLISDIEREVGPLTVGVVAFGDMGNQEESAADFEAARRVFDINYTGAASISEALARTFETRSHGSIIGLSSVAGERGRQSNYFYGSAKGAYSLYLQGLAHRLAGSGAHVLTVKLGFIDTRMTFGLATAIPIAKPEDAAKAIVRAQRKQKAQLYYPSFWGPVMGIIKAIPNKIMHRTQL
jgi:NAD(P)-dependent dehydrogenase (short-subunit alcohol dehydrogenase family)